MDTFTKPTIEYADIWPLIVVFGVQPRLLLDLVQVTVIDTLRSAEAGEAYAVGPEIVIAGTAAVVVLILARIGWVLAHGGESAPGGTAPAGATAEAAH